MAYQAYKYIYQSILVVFNRGWKDKHSEWNAAATMPLAFLLLFILVIDRLDLMPRIENYLDGVVAILSLYMSMVMVNYFLFIQEDKYKELLAEYEQKSNGYKRISRWFGLLIGSGGYVIPVLYLLFHLRLSG